MSNQPERERLKMPHELLMAALSIISNNPGVGRKELILALLKKDPRWAIHFYKYYVGKSLTYPDQVRIAGCNTIANGRSLYNKLLRDRDEEFCIDWSVSTRIKNALRKLGYNIFGSHGFGYRMEEDLNPELAAIWLRQRLRKLQNESDQFHTAGNIIVNGASNSDQRRVARRVMGWIEGSINHTELKGMTDELEQQFISDENPDPHPDA